MIKLQAKKGGDKHSEPLSGEAVQRELTKVEVIQDTSLAHKVSFSRNGEVIKAFEIPEGIVNEATSEGGLMVEFGLLLPVPESRDKIMPPVRLKAKEKSGFHLALEEAVKQIINKPDSELSNVEKVKYINTIVAGLDEFIAGNEAYEEIVSSIRIDIRRNLKPIISQLRKEGFVLLPHEQQFKKLSPSDDKKPLFLNKYLFDWHGAVSLKEIGAEVIPGITLGGDKRIPLVVAPFTEESLKGSLKYQRKWYTWPREYRLPLILTDRFIAVPEQSRGIQKLKELADKRAKGKQLTEKEEKFFDSLLQMVNILTAEEVVTSYEVSTPKENLRVVPKNEIVQEKGEIDSEAINNFLAAPPFVTGQGEVLSRDEEGIPADANQKFILKDGKLVEVGTGKKNLDSVEQIEPLAGGYFIARTHTTYLLINEAGEKISPFLNKRSTGNILVSSDKRFVYCQDNDETILPVVFDLKTENTYYFDSGFCTMPMILPGRLLKNVNVDPVGIEYSNLQVSKDGKYLTYLKDGEISVEKTLVVVEIADEPKTEKEFNLYKKGAESVVEVALGGGNFQYAINPFANVIFVQNKETNLLALVDANTGEVVAKDAKYLHTDSTGAYTVIIRTDGTTNIWLNKKSAFLKKEDEPFPLNVQHARIKTLPTYTRNFHFVVFPGGSGYFFTETGDIEYFPNITRPLLSNYEEVFVPATGQQQYWFKSRNDGELFETSDNPLQKLDGKGEYGYKHPDFDLFIKNNEDGESVAYDLKSKDEFQFEGEVVFYDDAWKEPLVRNNGKYRWIASLQDENSSERFRISKRLLICGGIKFYQKEMNLLLRRGQLISLYLSWFLQSINQKLKMHLKRKLMICTNSKRKR